MTARWGLALLNAEMVKTVSKRFFAFFSAKNGDQKWSGAMLPSIKQAISRPLLSNLVPLRLKKAGRVWCGGARETH